MHYCALNSNPKSVVLSLLLSLPFLQSLASPSETAYSAALLLLCVDCVMCFFIHLIEMVCVLLFTRCYGNTNYK